VANMNESKNSIELLERNIVLLLNRLKDNHFVIKDLTKKLVNNETTNSVLSMKNDHFKQENITLKSANSLLGSKEDNTIIRSKINNLIKEVDQCIYQLNNLD